MTSFEASVEIHAPAQQVWDALTAWEAQGEWMPATTVVIEAGPPQGIGTRLRAFTGLGPLGVTDPMTVDVWQPPQRCEVTHHGRLVTGRGVFEIVELPGGRSRFTWREELSGTGARALFDRASVPVSRLALGVAVKRLKRRVEQGR